MEEIKFEEKLNIPKNSKFRIVEKMKWNNEIYLIEILQDQFHNNELKNISWTQLITSSKILELI